MEDHNTDVRQKFVTPACPIRAPDTPNLPDLRAIDWRMAGLLGLPELVVGQTREVADRLAFEQEAACAVVAGFVLKEAQVCEEERVAAQGL